MALDPRQVEVEELDRGDPAAAQGAEHVAGGREGIKRLHGRASLYRIREAGGTPWVA